MGIDAVNKLPAVKYDRTEEEAMGHISQAPSGSGGHCSAAYRSASVRMRVAIPLAWLTQNPGKTFQEAIFAVSVSILVIFKMFFWGVILTMSSGYNISLCKNRTRCVYKDSMSRRFCRKS